MSEIRSFYVEPAAFGAAALAGLAAGVWSGLEELEALLETALDYPYVTDMLAFSDPAQGFWSNASYNDDLTELVTRPDAAAVVERAFSQIPPLTEITDTETMVRWYKLSAFSQGLANPPEA